jgi:hypothetical protein
MKNITRKLFVLLFFAGLLSSNTFISAFDWGGGGGGGGTVTVWGYVRDDSTGQGLPNAIVVGTVGDSNVIAVTSSTGYYTVSGTTQYTTTTAVLTYQITGWDTQVKTYTALYTGVSYKRNIDLDRAVYFNINDPFTTTKNEATDQFRHPNSLTVYKASVQILIAAGRTLSEVDTPQKWMEAIWDRLSSYTIAPYNSNPNWYTDIYMSEDYLNNGKLDGIAYECSCYSVFIAGLARSVGLPSRMWSIVYKTQQGAAEPHYYEHMLTEVYVGTSSINNGWWAIDLGHTISDGRVNWEDWISNPNEFRTTIGAVYDTTALRWELNQALVIYDIYDSLPFEGGYQEKAWVTTDQADPSIWVPADYYFYNIAIIGL